MAVTDKIIHPFHGEITPDLVVLVGNGMGPENQEKIAQVISDHGIAVYLVATRWPRDAYIYFNGKYYLRLNHGSSAEGGMALPGRNYLLFSDDAYNPRYFPYDPEIADAGLDMAAPYVDWTSFRLFLKKQLEEMYLAQVFVLPAEIREKVLGYKHLDYFSLLLPLTEMFIVDVIKSNAYRDPVFEPLVHLAGLKFDLYDSSRDFLVRGAEWPLNALVLFDETKEHVFQDSRAVDLGIFLEKNGVLHIDVPVGFHYGGGSIHCATNIFYKRHDFTADYLLQHQVLSYKERASKPQTINILT